MKLLYDLQRWQNSSQVKSKLSDRFEVEDGQIELAKWRECRATLRSKDGFVPTCRKAAAPVKETSTSALDCGRLRRGEKMQEQCSGPDSPSQQGELKRKRAAFSLRKELYWFAQPLSVRQCVRMSARKTNFGFYFFICRQDWGEKLVLQ